MCSVFLWRIKKTDTGKDIGMLTTNCLKSESCTVLVTVIPTFQAINFYSIFVSCVGGEGKILHPADGSETNIV